ncbi:hypothetical protein HK102_005847 [Quaeritorhiza haematococci]|nr:hypothetical protein HK102_005847 [Quaeritorhiza haematococci]
MKLASVLAALLLSATSVFATGVYVVANDGMIDLQDCKAEDIIWQLWNRCGQTSCPEQKIWCPGTSKYLRMTSSYNSWESRNVFINVLHQAWKHAVKVYWERKRVCHHGDCDVAEIEHRNYPRQMRVEMWSQKKGEGGFQMGHMTIEFVGPSEGNKCDFLEGAINAGLSAVQPIVGFIATIFGGVACMAQNLRTIETARFLEPNNTLIANATLEASNTTAL